MDDKQQMMIEEQITKNPDSFVSFSFDHSPLYQGNKSDIMYF